MIGKPSMAREQRRLLMSAECLEAAGSSGVLALSSEQSHYLSRVLRYRSGDHFTVVDGMGHLWEAELQASDRAQLLQPLQQPLLSTPQPQPRLVLAAAVVKRDFDLVVRMAVELGVDRLVPLLCDHTAVQGQLRHERWKTIAAEAAEQCERLWLPQIEATMPVKALLDKPSTNGVALWATTRQQQLPALAEALSRSTPAPQEVWLACGPEGGWSVAEEMQATSRGWEPVQLGPAILRSSTACVAGMSLLSSWRSRHGSGAD